MLFESFAEAQSTFLWGAFAIAVVLGMVVNKTNFCTMGAVSDMVNMGEMGRMRAWLLAIAVAVIGVNSLEYLDILSADGAFPPYRGSRFVWAENILGGVMFGIGMTLASGCGNKTLIRIGGGNLKSILVLAIIGVIAYFMVNPFPGTDKTLMSELFYPWLSPLAVSLDKGQDLGSLISADNAVTVRLVAGLLIGLAMLVYIFRSAEFRSNFDNVLGGLVVGLAVLGAWYLTSTVAVDVDGEATGLASYVENWDFIAESDEGKPAEARTLNPQSFTFINPMGQTGGYLVSGLDSALLTFGIMSVFGVILGSLLWSLISRSFRIEWFASFKDFYTHVIGAVLMGFGGVLGMGCTIGQGITGFSTLAVGSMLTFVAIIFGSALTMKIQYYKLVYEEEAGFVAALVTALADMKLLPDGLRKLEKI